MLLSHSAMSSHSEVSEVSDVSSLIMNPFWTSVGAFSSALPGTVQDHGFLRLDDLRPAAQAFLFWQTSAPTAYRLGPVGGHLKSMEAKRTGSQVSQSRPVVAPLHLVVPNVGRLVRKVARKAIECSAGLAARPR